MPTAPHTPAQHHYEQAERTLATLGALGATPEEATREAAVALCHATLSIAAAIMALRGNGGPGQHAAG